MNEDKRYTRHYTWAAPANKGKLNLDEYTDVIDEAVTEVLPDDYDPVVSVGKDDFVIDTAEPITNSQSRQLGQKIAETKDIGKLCKSYEYKNDGKSNQIFKGTDISE